MGRLHVVRGAFEQSISLLQPAMPMFEGGALTVYFPRIASSLGAAYVYTGRVAEGVALLRQACERGPFSWPSRAPLGPALGRAGLLAGARPGERPRPALELARQSRARGGEAYTRHLQGDLAALADPPDATTAEVHYREALTLAEELGMRPLVTHCHLGLGKLYRRIGDRAKATEHLTTAATMYREMDMRFWLEKADAELGGVER